MLIHNNPVLCAQPQRTANKPNSISATTSSGNAIDTIYTTTTVLLETLTNYMLCVLDIRLSLFKVQASTHTHGIVIDKCKCCWMLLFGNDSYHSKISRVSQTKVPIFYQQQQRNTGRYLYLPPPLSNVWRCGRSR